MARTSVWGVEKWCVRHYPTSEAIETCPGREDQQILDSTLQHRASLPPENAKRFHHGQGFVIGHQWTNILLIINDMLIPLRPIPFYSQRDGRDHDLAYQTEHALVIDYLRQLDLVDSIGSYDPREVVVLTDSGYDNKKIETAITNTYEVPRCQETDSS